MKLFYEEYKDDANLHQLVANLPWDIICCWL